MVVRSTTLLSQSNSLAGLGRISHAVAGKSSYVFDSSAGAGIVAYVVDTGIRTTRRPNPEPTTITNFAGIPRTCNLGCKYGEHGRKSSSSSF